MSFIRPLSCLTICSRGPVDDGTTLFGRVFGGMCSLRIMSTCHVYPVIYARTAAAEAVSNERRAPFSAFVSVFINQKQAFSHYHIPVLVEVVTVSHRCIPFSLAKQDNTDGGKKQAQMNKSQCNCYTYCITPTMFTSKACTGKTRFNHETLVS